MKLALVSSLLLSSSMAFVPLSHPPPSAPYGVMTQSSSVTRSRPSIGARSTPWALASQHGTTTVLEKDETKLASKEKNDATTNNHQAVTTLASSSIEDSSKSVLATDEEMSETQKLMQQVKDAGVAGVISYALWELGFWAVSLPVVIFGYYAAVGHFPDFSNKEDVAKLGAEAFAFVNFARFAVPLRIGLALSTTPWIQTNIVDKYMKKDDAEEEKMEEPVMAYDQPTLEVTTEEPDTKEVLKQVPRWRSFLPFGRRKN